MKKILVLAALMVFAPVLSPAQETFGFGSNSPWGDTPRGEDEDDNVGLTIETQSFGEPAPLGSGIAILVASAAGYTILKKRNDKKSTNN